MNERATLDARPAFATALVTYRAALMRDMFFAGRDGVIVLLGIDEVGTDAAPRFGMVVCWRKRYPTLHPCGPKAGPHPAAR
jgi:hypothetical protein